MYKLEGRKNTMCSKGLVSGTNNHLFCALISENQGLEKLRCTEKKFSSAGPEIFLRFETDLNFSRPSFSEMKVQIKWP